MIVGVIFDLSVLTFLVFMALLTIFLVVSPFIFKYCDTFKSALYVYLFLIMSIIGIILLYYIHPNIFHIIINIISILFYIWFTYFLSSIFYSVVYDEYKYYKKNKNKIHNKKAGVKK